MDVLLISMAYKALLLGPITTHFSKSAGPGQYVGGSNFTYLSQEKYRTRSRFSPLFLTSISFHLSLGASHL